MKQKRTVTTLFILMTLVGLTLVALPQKLSAKTPVDLNHSMASAQRLYEQGQYEEAAQIYQQLVEQGIEDSRLFHKLGNAYFKQGDTGRAVLNYRRAEQLAPRDAGIEANLQLARQSVEEPLTLSEGASPMQRMASLSQGWLTWNELGLLTLAVWLIFIATLILFLNGRSGSKLRRMLKIGLVVSGLGLAIGLFAVGGRYQVERSYPAAVIVAAETAVSAGPGTQYSAAAVLHSGAEVSTLEQRGYWVRLAGPTQAPLGWVPVTAVETIN